MDFQRARSDEQRERRRRGILEATAAMLAKMAVADVTLLEVSRRVGLARSNVLRYFESREAILLDLLDASLRDWVGEMPALLTPAEGTAGERAGLVASAVASSIARRPVLCDLISAQAAVLERNISAEVALRHKRAIAEPVTELVGLITGVLPELEAADAYRIVVIILFMTSGAWPHGQPSEAVRVAYATDPAVAAHQADFTEVLRSTVELSLAGLLLRRGASA